jgi:hypothetical protein
LLVFYIPEDKVFAEAVKRMEDHGYQQIEPRIHTGRTRVARLKTRMAGAWSFTTVKHFVDRQVRFADRGGRQSLRHLET